MVGSSKLAKVTLTALQSLTLNRTPKYGIPESQVGKPKHICDALADAMEETVQRLASQKEPFYLQCMPMPFMDLSIRPDLKEKALKRFSPKLKKANLAGFISGMDAVHGGNFFL